MRSFTLVPLVLASLLAAGCADETTSPVPGAAPVAAKDFVEAYASAVCDHAVLCYAAASYLGASCVADVKRSFGEDVTAAIEAGHITYDEDAAGVCIAGIAATECLAEQASDATLAACLKALTGKVATGAPCAGTYECAEGVCPSVTGDECPTVCAPVALQGEACSNLAGPTCDVRRGLRCSSGTCVVPAAKDSACVDNDGCESGLVCVGNVCGPRRPTGAGCAKDSSCAPGNYCIADSDEGGLCAERLALGGECGLDVQNTSAAFRHVQCLDGFTCKGAGLTNEGVSIAGSCSLASEEGASCTVEPDGFQLFDTGCRGGLVCTGGKCAKPPAVGAACSQHFLCDAATAYCDQVTTVCTARKANGEACTVDPECEGDFCNSKGKCTDLATFCAP